jgi:sulfur carrier protein ThiS
MSARLCVTVKLYGTLRRLSQPETPGLWQGEVPAGTDIAGLVRLLGTRLDEVAAAAINGEPAPLETRLADGDVVVLVTPVGGG